jgi:hypothetical protein
MAGKKGYKTARERMMEKARLGPNEDTDAASGMEANPPPPVPKTAAEILAGTTAFLTERLKAVNGGITNLRAEAAQLQTEKEHIEFTLTLLTVPTVANNKEKGEKFDKDWDLPRQIQYVLQRYGPMPTKDIRSHLFDLSGKEYSGQKIGQTLATNPWCFRQTGEKALIGAGAIWEYSRDDSRGD